MAFKKHSWIKYGRRGRVGKLQVLDEDGNLLDKAEWLLSDKDAERKVFTIFKNEWGVFKKPSIKTEDSINKFIL